MGLGGMSCGMKCVRNILFFFNLLFWLGGLAMIGIGVWFLVDTSSLAYVVSFVTMFDGLDSEDMGLKLIAYLFIGLGAFIFIVGFCGCCGAIKENKCLLCMYIFFVVLVIAGQVAGGVLTLIYNQRIEDNLANQGLDYIRTSYMNSQSPDFGLNWLQYEFKCCGVNGPIDYRNSSYSFSSSGFPVSPYCCRMKSSYDFDKRVPDAENQPGCMSEAGFCHAGSCAANTAELRTTGCLQATIDWMESKLPILIGIGFGIAGLEIIGIIMAVCLCRVIRKDK